MLQRAVTICLIGSAALFAQKPSREILELQRDVARLQELITGLQQTLEQRVAGVGTQTEAMTASVEKLNATVASVQASIQEQNRNLVPQVAAQGSRVEQVATTLSTMQQALADLTGAVNRLQTQMVDLGNVVKVISTPAPKPPSAEELLKSADADRLGGKYELAAQGYADFLKSYADSPQADMAQFQLGVAHFQLKDMESAARDFDAVAQKYPKSARVAEALFYKAKSLQALDRASDAAAACTELRRRFPRSEFAKLCAAPRQ